MAIKEVSLSIDVEELENQIEEKREQEALEDGEEDLEVRSTVFSLGKDPRVGTKREITTPDLRLIEIQKDGIDNPFVELHWRVPRFDIDSAGVQGFNIYRRRLSRQEITLSTRDRKSARLRQYNRTGFDKIARKIPRRGKFGFHRKSIPNIRRSLIPRSILNPRLEQAEAIARARFQSSLNRGRNIRGFGRFPVLHAGNEPTVFRASEDKFFNAKRFEKLAYIDYTKFLAQEKQKFIQVTEREFVDLSYKDSKIGYGEVFEYYITSVAEEEGEGPRSNIVQVKVEDLTPIRPPTELRVLQLNEREVQLRICADPRDDVGQAIVFRRPEDEITFTRVASIPNLTDCINLVDETVNYNRSYIYRVFLENIHGTVSEPGEIEITSTVQKITPQSRSNNLKIPIITAIQDQNSDFVKITISSNDPKVAYYELQRRDLTIHERRFSTPSKLETNFGGDGWTTNKLFVDKEREQFEQEISQERDLLNRRGTESEIVFIDDAVQIGHIYQYRVRGCDLFCNASSYALSTVKVVGKKRLRTPVNLKAQVLRGSPFRVKITWDDDNLATTYDDEELFKVDTALSQSDVKLIYQVERRKLGEVQYDKFPFTANQFIVDESVNLNPVNFEGKKADDIFTVEPNVEQEEANVTISGESLQRAFDLPEFLEENDIYFYRVFAKNSLGEESNFTEEFEVSTLPDLSDPTNFKVEVLNTRVRPLVARLTWGVESTKARPDHWIIERKFDVDNDSFEVVGKAYIDTEFFDRGLEAGASYLYRIKAVDVIGRESAFFDARLSL